MSKSSRVIDGLKTNTLYSFYVRAKNVVGQWSDLPAVVTHTTLYDTTTPAVLSSITLLMLAGMFQLKWAKPATLDLRGGGFKIYVYTANTVASSVLIREVGYTADSAIILIGEKSQDASITIAAGTTYYFWVTTLDDSRNESAKVATTPGSGSVSVVGTGLDHHVLTNLLVDDHTQYALLAGRATGQTLYGGVAASENLNLKSTSHATKGKIYFGANAYFDETDTRFQFPADGTIFYQTNLSSDQGFIAMTLGSNLNVGGGSGYWQSSYFGYNIREAKPNHPYFMIGLETNWWEAIGGNYVSEWWIERKDTDGTTTRPFGAGTWDGHSEVGCRIDQFTIYNRLGTNILFDVHPTYSQFNQKVKFADKIRIGATDNPLEALHITGCIRVGGNPSGVFLIPSSGQAVRTGEVGTNIYLDVGSLYVRNGTGSAGNAGLIVGQNYFVVNYTTGRVGVNDASPGEQLDVGGNINATGVIKIDDVQVVSNRVIDARCDDAINSGDATTDGVIDALRDAMITHGLIAAA